MDNTHALLVCYSYSGHSRRLARQLAKMHGWPLGEIQLQEPRSGWMGYAQCLLDSLLHRRPAIRYHGPAPNEFDITVLVSPVWAGRLASPMRSFMTQYLDKLGPTAVLEVMGGSGAAGAIGEANALLRRPPVFSTAFLQHEVQAQGPEHLARLRDLPQSLAPAVPSWAAAA
ncbi:MAG: flavodoxin family protein [Inhella sp.]|uniref:flavodoxin family protein n=1 Tax=Inhella sp. TaxID=1921806 RepID=UPI00391F223E